MSRKVREIKKNFKVFCEGDTEYHYIDGMRQKLRLSITLKLVNMKGGGYSSFLESLKIDGNVNCLVKFIIIDGDRAAHEEGEKKKLRELAEYCMLQNRSGRVPHILIVNYPDFEYVACLHAPWAAAFPSRYLVISSPVKKVSRFRAGIPSTVL